MTDISREELDEIHAFAVRLGKEAGKMLMDGARLRMGDAGVNEEQKEHVQKENAVDLVTETDEGEPLRLTSMPAGIFLILPRRHTQQRPLYLYAELKPCRRRSIYQKANCRKIPLAQVGSSLYLMYTRTSNAVANCFLDSLARSHIPKVHQETI